MSGAEPLVSVVVPAYNASSRLPATLASILSQTHPALEVLVVDDGSTDGTAAVIDAAAAVDSRVRRLDQGGNRGRSSARNHGIENASGRWVAFVDADDLWSRDRIERLVAATRSFPASSVFFDDRLQFHVDVEGVVTLGHRYPYRHSVRVGRVHEVDLRVWMTERLCRMDPFVSRRLLMEAPLRYPEDLSVGEDLCFVTQLAFWPGTRTVRVGHGGYYYRMDDTARAARSAQSWLAGMDRAIEVTGSAELADLVRRVTPGWSFVANRADRVFARSGRVTDADVGATGSPVPASALRGYARLAYWRLLQELSRIADRPSRDAVIADITAQLDAAPTAAP